MHMFETTLPGVRRIELDVFEDHRGEYVELYNRDGYDAQGADAQFVQDDISVSNKHVLRGIHVDLACWKLISCLLGRIYLIIVNCEPGNPQFGRWEAFTLSDRNRCQILVPPLHGVAHLALSAKIIFYYKQSLNYDRDRQLTYRWDDPRFKIWWPIATPILSQRDMVGKYVD